MAVPYTAIPRATRRRELSAPDYDTDSLLKSVGRRTLGGLGMVGNFLDLPGSSVRDVLTGENPFDQWMSPFTDDNRVSGRDLMQRYGMLGRNKKGFDWGDVAGFFGEVALDPLTYLTLGGSALGKGGQIAKRAGVLTDALKATGKGPRVARMTETLGGIAKNANADQLSRLGDAATKMGFSSLDEALARHGDEAVGGLIGLGLPFRAPSMTLGKAGGKAESVARMLDKAGAGLRYGKVPGTQFSPGQQLFRVFSAKAMGLQTPEVGKFGPEMHAAREAIHVGVKKDSARDALRLLGQGMLDDEASMLGRMHAEGVLDFNSLTKDARKKAEVVSEILKPYGRQMSDEAHIAKTLGVRMDEFGDPAGIAHWPRQFVDYVTNHANTMPREDYLRGIKEGTEQLRKIISDPKVLDGTIDDAYDYVLREYGDKILTPTTPVKRSTLSKASSTGARTSPTGVENTIASAGRRKRMVGNVMDELRQAGSSASEEELAAQAWREVRKKGNKQVGGRAVQGGAQTTLKYDLPVSKTSEHAADVAARSDLIEQLVHRIRNVYTKEQRAVGGFGRNALLDAQDALIGLKWKNARAGAVIESLKSFAKPLREMDDVAGNTDTVAHVLELAGLDATTSVKGSVRNVGGESVRMGPEVESGALHQLAKAFGLSPTAENLAEVARMHVPVNLADDIVRQMKGDDIKTVAGTLLSMFDSMTNVFKVGVLNWPARYVRDMTSGQAMNMLTGNWSAKAFNHAHSLLAGGVADFTEIPIVARMLAEQGLEATAENSTDIMRQLVYAHDVFTGMHGAQGAGEVVGGLSLPGRSADFAAEFIGKDPITPLRPRTLKGGTTLKPWKLRGVGGQLRTENILAATGERAGKYTDGMNRLVPFIKNLESGMDPSEAKRLVDGLQVNYSPRAYTAAEKKYLKRAFPFYSYSSKMLQHVMSELAQHPGGGIAQSIRASNEMRGDQPVPEYVAQGMSIPLGELSDGTQRFLSGFSLMHEDPLALFSARGGRPDVTDTLAELISRTNPYAIKLPIELAAGESFFQRGPLGGRELSDMDPTYGRLLTNIGLRDELPTGRAKPVVSTNFENLLSNLPTSRLGTTLRSMTDPRKYQGGPFPGSVALMNNLTGVRVSDVSPANQDAIIRDELFAMMREQGARAFESVRYSRSDIEKAEKTNPDLAEQMKRYNAAVAALTNRAKARKKASELTAKPSGR